MKVETEEILSYEIQCERKNDFNHYSVVVYSEEEVISYIENHKEELTWWSVTKKSRLVIL